jgi:hypothetical protein
VWSQQRCSQQGLAPLNERLPCWANQERPAQESGSFLPWKPDSLVHLLNQQWLRQGGVDTRSCSTWISSIRGKSGERNRAMIASWTLCSQQRETAGKISHNWWAGGRPENSGRISRAPSGWITQSAALAFQQDWIKFRVFFLWDL